MHPTVQRSLCLAKGTQFPGEEARCSFPQWKLPCLVIAQQEKQNWHYQSSFEDGSQSTPQFFIFKQSQRELRNETHNSLFTLEAKIHVSPMSGYNKWITAKHSWTIILNSLLPHFKAVPASCKKSVIFFFCRLHCLVSYTAWHYSWFCFTCCFIFPTALGNCNLNITPVRQRTEEHIFPSSNIHKVSALAQYITW